ncbi:dnaJ homolog subfamily C member 17-like [Macaca thibetana thibetana]|uniref:dnaJ homolog subfamily C member 17-like n=1 Tax=Macaca thibetana thibetana TaxID=257877 RepID=UPI0021BC8647|nr:dnaJ homolog subfamily C member 17-like [Macaca thibetana thibetana]
MAVTKELLQMDLYALLGIEQTATDKEVKKAYRQKALSCHPDKNPDNPRAAELFPQLSRALEVLTDATARVTYDKVRKARKQAAETTQKLNDRRKRVRLELEAREQQAQAQRSEDAEGSRNPRTLEQEIQRLREEGFRQLEEQQKLFREQILQARAQRWKEKAESTRGRGTPKLKLKWKCKTEDASKGGYSQGVLLQLLQKYGEVHNPVLSSKKAGVAVVEFETVKSAKLAVRNEVGLVENPLKISWLEGRPQGAVGPSNPGRSKDSVLWERDFDSLVMMRMRAAAERQQLITQAAAAGLGKTHTMPGAQSNLGSPPGKDEALSCLEEEQQRFKVRPGSRRELSSGRKEGPTSWTLHRGLVIPEDCRESTLIPGLVQKAITSFADFT